MTKLPIGDKTLSSKEIIANESQERMGLLIDEKHIEHVQKIAERERAPMYVVGETTGDAHFSFKQGDGVKPFDLDVAQMFGHSPKTIMRDNTVERKYDDVTYSQDKIQEYLKRVLQLESVACKDWLTNKVDRSVTGKIARQQCQGEIQLPLSDCGVVALDYRGRKGIATALGHAPQAGLASPEAGSVLSVAEALTNIVWAPLADGMDSLSLSANWMWPPSSILMARRLSLQEPLSSAQVARYQTSAKWYLPLSSTTSTLRFTTSISRSTSSVSVVLPLPRVLARWAAMFLLLRMPNTLPMPSWPFSNSLRRAG